MVAIAVAVLALTAPPAIDAAAFTCPSALQTPAPRTLSMNCLGACPDAYSPCLYYANATACSGLMTLPQYGGIGSSVCVVGGGAQCAIECLAPLSGRANDTWQLELTTTGAGRADDKHAAQLADPFFRIVTRPVAFVNKITDLTFAPTTTHVVITGEALPVRDKLRTYTVVEKGSVVYVAIQLVDILRNARNVTSVTVENVDLYGLASFPSAPKLESLILSNNRLEAVPKGISGLAGIKILDLSQNLFKIVSLDDLPTNVEVLNLQLCSLTELPSAILKMPKLKALDVSGNMFPIPAADTLPLQLETLSLAFLTLRTLPPDVKRMTQLTYIDLEWNEFRDADLRDLPRSLETLRLGDSQLTALPDDFASLTRLTTLDLSSNELTDLKPQALPASLKALNLSRNALVTLRADALPRTLEALDLSLNKLTALPAGFAQLQSLQSLQLGSSAFSTFPTAVFELAALQTLTISSPKLEDVAFTRAQVARLAALTTFTINAEALATSCGAAATVRVHAYAVCVTAKGASSTGANDGNDDSTADKHVALFALSGVGTAALVVLTGLVVWHRRRRTQRCKQSAGAADGSTGALRRSLSDKKMFCLDDQDSIMILESPNHDDDDDAAAAVATTTHNTNSDGSCRIDVRKASASFRSFVTVSNASSSTTTIRTKSSSSSRRFVSIWDDEELLTWRVDAAQVRTVKRLGGGFYGDVWLATYLGRAVASKRLKRAESVARAAIQQFVAEIRLLARFDHAKIVAFVGVAWTMESDIQALVEYLPRGDLCAYIAAQARVEPVPAMTVSRWDDAALRIAMDVAEALVYLHSLSPAVLHRDLKSRNVLLTDDLGAKVTDFGGSRSCYQDDETDSHNSMTAGVGTARWTAPEVLVGQRQYSAAVDMYSFGVILTELETFQIPYAERVGVPEACLLSRIAAGEVAPMLTDAAPHDVAALACQCLALDPAARPSAVHAAYALRQIAVATNSRYRRVTESAASVSTSSSSSLRASSTLQTPNFVGIL